MLHLLVSWLLSALALWLVAQIIPGIEVAGFGTALLATVVIALVNGTIGFVLKILTFPLTLLTLGLFLLVVNAFLLKLASVLRARVRGARVSFGAARVGGADHPDRHPPAPGVLIYGLPGNVLTPQTAGRTGRGDGLGGLPARTHGHAPAARAPSG